MSTKKYTTSDDPLIEKFWGEAAQLADEMHEAGEFDGDFLYICMECKTPNNHWTWLCGNCDAKADLHDPHEDGL